MAEQLHATSQITLKQSRAMVAQAEELTGHPAVLQQVEAGAVSYEQAVAAVTGLAALPDDLDAEQRAAAEAHVVEHMAGFDPVEIRRLTRGVVAIVAPELADEGAADFLERQERQAHRDRYLTWASNGQGSVVFRGQLPEADAEPVIVALRALSQVPRGVDSTLTSAAMSTGNQVPTRNQRHADALVRLVGMAAQSPDLPLLGGSRPRVHVTVSLEQLRDGLGSGALDHTGQPVSPGRCRQLACDAELIPIVLGGASEPLDVGRAHRLVTAPLRAALHARDGGCVFAGCDRPSRECDAHHLVPWWAGGRTSLSNLVMLCPHHHGMVEPPRDIAADPPGRWRIRIADDGIPETIPPRQVDPDQIPIRHARHRLMQLAS